MADNYLERRMEDYRAGRLGHPASHSRATTLPSPQAEPSLSGARVFIVTRSASASPRTAALIRLLRSQGCRVAFTDTDSAAGNRLAQATGAQCHPVDCSDADALDRSRALICRRWGGIDWEVGEIRERREI